MGLQSCGSGGCKDTLACPGTSEVLWWQGPTQRLCHGSGSRTSVECEGGDASQQDLSCTRDTATHISSCALQRWPGSRETVEAVEVVVAAVAPWCSGPVGLVAAKTHSPTRDLRGALVVGACSAPVTWAQVLVRAVSAKVAMHPSRSGPTPAKPQRALFLMPSGMQPGSGEAVAVAVMMGAGAACGCQVTSLPQPLAGPW